jgi:Protein of unknown function (DUF3667)
MSGELAGAADIITGAALARAVEPEAGEGRGAEKACLNCGTALIGAHCHMCGQKAHVHRTLHEFGHDILHSVLHFDGKIWRTLPLLFWKPGDLTRRYVHGERAKFVSPLALFLFSVFLTFATFNWLVPDGGASIQAPDTIESVRKEYLADRKEIEDAIAALEAEKKAVPQADAADIERIEAKIARNRERLQSIEDGRGRELRQMEAANEQFFSEKRKIDADIEQLETRLAAARKAGKPTKKLEEDLEGAKMAARVIDTAAGGLQNGLDEDTDWTFTDLNFPGSGALNKAVKTAGKNPQLLLYKIQSNAYKYSWALIPISVPFVWLLFFWRRRFKMFDHAVFVTYSITFMMLLGIICAILINTGFGPIGGLLLAFYPPIHMYRQLHHAYQTSRFGAFWRMCFLSFFAMTALMLFTMLIVSLGAS